VQNVCALVYTDGAELFLELLDKGGILVLELQLKLVLVLVLVLVVGIGIGIGIGIVRG
jgi:hypothetical protein